MDAKQLTFRHRIIALILCSVVFLIVYSFCGTYTGRLSYVPSITFFFEKEIPFVPLFIFPYMSSGIFFIWVFFWVRNEEQLRILTYRILFIILVAGGCYLLFPLHFSFEKPSVNVPLFRIFFEELKKIDTPFNQAPSLHVAFALIFWQEGKEYFTGIKKYFLFLWLLMLILSTLLVYQHHLIDIFSGALLAILSFLIIKR
jgi:ser/thr and tyr protein phosphatase (dual specificity)